MYKLKLFINDYGSASAAWARAAKKENGRPLAKDTRLVAKASHLCVQFLHKFSSSEQTPQGTYISHSHEVWRDIVTYRPDGSILIDTCNIGDRLVWDRINDFSPIMVYKQGWHDYIRFFRFRGKDYVYGHSSVAVFLSADWRRRPRYVASANSSYKDKEFSGGKPCWTRAAWNERETDKDEVRHLLNRLGYLITKHQMWACLGYHVKQRIDHYLQEIRAAEAQRGKRSGARVGKQLRSINLEPTPCGDTTTQTE